MNIEITPKAVLVTLATLVGVWLLWQVWPIIAALFVAFIIASALAPSVDSLVRRKVKRGLAVTFVYLLMLIAFGTLGALIVPPMVTQTQRLIVSLPQILAGLLTSSGLQAYTGKLVEVLLGYAASSSGDVVKATVGVFSNVVMILTILVFAFYLLLERDKIKDKFFGFFPRDHSRVKNVLELVEKKLGAWIRGQVTLALIVGASCFVGLSLLRVDYALSLALIAGVLEIFPIIGPTVAAVPAIIVALASSPLLALGVFALYFLVQQLENNIFVPKVMQQTVGLDPLVTLLAIAIGGQVMGVGGALLAIPFTAVAVIVVQDLTGKSSRSKRRSS